MAATWQVRTYDVIPMSRTLGILEYVADTKPLMSVIEGVVGKAEVAAANDCFQKCVPRF